MSENVFEQANWWDPDGFLIGLRDLLNPVRIPYIAHQLHRHGASNVLDVGCGGGYLSEALGSAGFSTVGIDLSLGAIGAAAAADDKTRYSVADAQRIPFDAATFDAVLISEVLEHVDHPRHILSEAARVLTTGGLVVVTGPNRTWLSQIILIWLAQEWPTRVIPRGLHSHDAFVAPDQLWRWGGDFGLQPVDLTGIGIPADRLFGSVRALARLKRGSISYAEAGSAVSLVETRFTAIAYMATARKGC